LEPAQTIKLVRIKTGGRYFMAFKGRRARSQSPAIVQHEPIGTGPKDGTAADNVTVMPNGIGQDIPPHVWNLLQTAGELGAARLVQILQSPAFPSMAPSAQRGLIELALTRAYGLPIRKALNVNLTTGDADAVAASLADLASNLPETQREAVFRAARGGDDGFGGEGSQNA
jgi:hypothetical protein